MQAYVLTRYGGPRAMQLREVPEPTAGAGEVLIRVRAAGLNPVDYKVRKGFGRVFHLDLPLVAGSELSGVVAAVGAGATRFGIGDRVYARVDKQKLGAYAGYAVVDENFVARMPRSLDFEDAAGMPLAGLTALQALRQLAITPGDRVFISGGAGGVGTLAIQLAAQMGAKVATTASPRGEELVRSLGAETVIDYREQKFKDVLNEYDSAFDTTGGRDLTDIFDILKPGAKAVSVTSFDPTTARDDVGMGRLLTAAVWAANTKIRRKSRRRGVSYRSLLMHPSGEGLEALTDLVDSGELKPVTDRVFPFEQLPDAFAYLEEGHAKGKVVVRL
jgi:NADPH:quinone reductase-like Zn-dependent oxidoreductase